MTKRILAALLALGVALAGLAVAQDPAPKDEPPLRLKKKPKKPAKPDEAAPDKPTPKKPDTKKPEEKKPAEAEPEPEPEPEVNAEEVLNRVAKNVRIVEDKLAHRELTDSTRQTQDDILKDIDSLIRQAQSPQSGGSGGADQKQDQQDQQNQQDQQDQQSGKNQAGKNSKNSSGKNGQAQPQPGGGKKTGRRQRGAWRQVKGRGQRGQRQQMVRGNNFRGQKKPGGRQGSGSGNSKPQPNQKPGGGKSPGGGGNKAGAGPDKTADLYKDVWGHLPESLRAEMNAYSNPRPFLPRYDDLIKRYYRTIAEQGRRKGD